jgi:predicted exporter
MSGNALSSDPGSRILTCLTSEWERAKDSLRLWREARLATEAAYEELTRLNRFPELTARNAGVLIKQEARLRAYEGRAEVRVAHAFEAIQEQQLLNNADYYQRVIDSLAIDRAADRSRFSWKEGDVRG